MSGLVFYPQELQTDPGTLLVGGLRKPGQPSKQLQLFQLGSQIAVVANFTAFVTAKVNTGKD